MTSEPWHANRVAVVTGGNAGIGLAIAKALAVRGARVAVGARRTGDAAVAAQTEDEIGNGAVAAALDVCHTASVADFIADVRDRLGTPDILVNSAGVSVHQTVCGHSDEDWDAVIDANLSGPFRMIRACLPSMIQSGWGRIINVASTAATTAMPTHAAYCASKSGLLGLTRAVAQEGAPHGVTALAVSPTWVETDMLRASAAKQAAAAGHDYATEMAALASANPQNRLVQAEEIAALVSFICSDQAPGLTMEDIQLNAGAQW
ncbi:MAG: SDR family oxidoreductase [Pseudomonadota bacterium]